jgi:hypothetical protein
MIPLACSPLALRLDWSGIDQIVHGDLIRYRMTKPTPKKFFAGPQLLLLSSLRANRPMYFPHTPEPLAPPPKGDGLLSACFDCSLAFLCRAGNLAAHVATGVSLVGLLRDGGVPNVGGELTVSVCGPGGGSNSFVNVLPGGVEGRTAPRASPRGQGLDGMTILASGLGALPLWFIGKAPLH